MKRQKDPTLANAPRGTREDALRLIAEGFRNSVVARHINVDRHTIAKWRSSVDGQRLLAQYRKEREEAFRGTIEDARRILKTAVQRAARKLVERLDSKTPFESIAAAEAIFARVGLPKVDVLQTEEHAAVDLAVLSDDELQRLHELTRKAQPR